MSTNDSSTHQADRSTTRSSWLPCLLALCGAAGTLIPWLLHLTDRTESGVHDGLWFCLPGFLLVLLLAGRKRSWRLWILGGCLTVLPAAIELPRVWRQATETVEGSVGELLQAYAQRHLAAYLLILACGSGLLILGVLERRKGA